MKSSHCFLLLASSALAANQYEPARVQKNVRPRQYYTPSAEPPFPIPSSLISVQSSSGTGILLSTGIPLPTGFVSSSLLPPNSNSSTGLSTSVVLITRTSIEEPSDTTGISVSTSESPSLPSFTNTDATQSSWVIVSSTRSIPLSTDHKSSATGVLPSYGAPTAPYKNGSSSAHTTWGTGTEVIRSSQLTSALVSSTNTGPDSFNSSSTTFSFPSITASTRRYVNTTASATSSRGYYGPPNVTSTIRIPSPSLNSTRTPTVTLPSTVTSSITESATSPTLSSATGNTTASSSSSDWWWSSFTSFVPTASRNISTSLSYRTTAPSSSLNMTRTANISSWTSQPTSGSETSTDEISFSLTSPSATTRIPSSTPIDEISFSLFSSSRTARIPWPIPSTASSTVRLSSSIFNSTLTVPFPSSTSLASSASSTDEMSFSSSAISSPRIPSFTSIPVITPSISTTVTRSTMRSSTDEISSASFTSSSMPRIPSFTSIPVVTPSSLSRIRSSISSSTDDISFSFFSSSSAARIPSFTSTPVITTSSRATTTGSSFISSSVDSSSDWETSTEETSFSLFSSTSTVQFSSSQSLPSSKVSSSKGYGIPSVTSPSLSSMETSFSSLSAPQTSNTFTDATSFSFDPNPSRSFSTFTPSTFRTSFTSSHRFEEPSESGGYGLAPEPSNDASEISEKKHDEKRNVNKGLMAMWFL